ncbi:MAG: hypothetical protein ACRC8D_07165 [Aeromonas sp.]
MAKGPAKDFRDYAPGDLIRVFEGVLGNADHMERMKWSGDDYLSVKAVLGGGSVIIKARAATHKMAIWLSPAFLIANPGIELLLNEGCRSQFSRGWMQGARRYDVPPRFAPALAETVKRAVMPQGQEVKALSELPADLAGDVRRMHHDTYHLAVLDIATLAKTGPCDALVFGDGMGSLIFKGGRVFAMARFQAWSTSFRDWVAAPGIHSAAYVDMGNDHWEPMHPFLHRGSKVDMQYVREVMPDEWEEVLIMISKISGEVAAEMDEGTTVKSSSFH